MEVSFSSSEINQSTNLFFHLQFEVATVWLQDFLLECEAPAVWDPLDFVNGPVAALVYCSLNEVNSYSFSFHLLVQT